MFWRGGGVVEVGKLHILKGVFVLLLDFGLEEGRIIDVVVWVK